MRRLTSILFVVVATLLASALPAGAVGAFGPSVLPVGCTPGPSAASIASNGVVRGAVSCPAGSGDGPIYSFYVQARGYGSSITSKVGRVLATAWDGSDALYVVYAQGTSLQIAKWVQSTGAWSASTTLATGGGVVPYSADVVASNGHWWAVWSEQVGPGGEFAQTDLFQRGTLLGAQPRTRITFTTDTDDSEPSLGYYSGRITLIWTRQTQPQVPGPSDLRIASTTSGSWTSRTFAAVGEHNHSADSVNVNGTTYAAWSRDGKIVQADNAAGPFVSHTFATSGTTPKIGASWGKVFIGWTTGGSRLFFAERSVAGAWSSAILANAPGLAVAVLGQAGRARVVYVEGTRLRVRTQL